MKVRAEPHGTSDGRSFTVSYSREQDDPSGALSVLVHSGRLCSLLRQLGNRDGTGGIPGSPAELTEELRAVSEALAVLEARRRLLLLASRDRDKATWRDLGLTAATATMNVTRWVKAKRAEMAALGIWFDQAGLHEEPAGSEAAEDHWRRRDDYDDRDTGWTVGAEPVLRS